MLGYRTVRCANIPTADRDIFERYGETVMQLMVSTGFAPRAGELANMYSDPQRIENAVSWLTERGDKKANRERRLEHLNWGILVVAILATVFALPSFIEFVTRLL